MLFQIMHATKEYLKNLYHRYRKYPTHRKQGLIAGSLLGAIYSGIRSLFIKTPLVVPMVGAIFEPSSTRFIIASILGGAAGANIGDQLGQSMDVWTDQKKK